MMPALFIAHGAPLLAIENNEYTQFLSNLGKTMKRPTAILLFSAHWESRVQKVSVAENYDTIYDFGGFPDELYQIQYPAKGNQAVSSRVQQLFAEHDIAFEVETTRGLDHGAWVVLRLLFPEADIPVTAMSVNPLVSPEEQYKIGQALSELRSEGVLIIGSGGTVHNLGMVQWQSTTPAEWAVQFDHWLENHLVKWDLTQLFQYDTLAPHARLAVPPYGREHFVPLFYAMGSADSSQIATLLHRSYRYGTLSHSVWQFG